MAKVPRPWEAAGWIRGEKIPGGNQGHTYLARKKGDLEEHFGYILKELKRQSDSLSRRRFHVEVESLRVLDFNGVCKLIDTNAGDFAHDDDLFVVTERIVGTDLSSLAPLPMQFNDACGIVVSVLTTLAQCHHIGVVHRDIKPCHVILKDGDISSPVLIDFGLAFNTDTTLSSDLTAVDHGVGNRFILLPEQLDGTNKRDPVSDITQCVGLFFFLLTGLRPGLIGGPGGQAPHRRINLREAAPTIPPLLLKRVEVLFDVGFDWDSRKRWQTAVALSEEIAILQNPENGLPTRNFDVELASVVDAAVRNPEMELHKRSDQLFDYIRRTNTELGGKVVNRLKGMVAIHFTTVSPAPNLALHWQAIQEFGHKLHRIVTLGVSRQERSLAVVLSLANPNRTGVNTERILEETYPIDDPRSELRIHDECVRAWLKIADALLKSE